MADYLTTSAVDSLVKSYQSAQYSRRVYPLEVRQQKFSTLSSGWGDLKTKLTALKTTASDFKTATDSSLFFTRSVSVSNESVLTATASSNSPQSSYTMRVNQLAKSDLIVSETQASDTAVTTMAGTHTIQIGSGNYTSNVDVELTGTETNETIMEKLSLAINADKAVSLSDSFDPTAVFTGTGSFTIDINDVVGTDTAETISYDYGTTSKTYSEVMDDLVSNINTNVNGVLAEKIIDDITGFVSLQLTVEDSDDSITIGGTSTFLNMDVINEKGASGLANASLFSPATDQSKFSITSKESGYDNRLIMSDVSGSIFNQIGLTSALLTGRTISADDTSAGFIYSSTSSTDNALNAKVAFNGINIQRNSNVITDLVDSVTFNLSAVNKVEDPDVSISVKVDTESITADIKEFITNFNNTYTYIKNNSYSSGDKDNRGAFVGDSTARSLMSTLTNLAMGQVSGLQTGNLSYLSEIGISFSPATGLSISDSSKLETSLEENASQVADLFSSTNGIANTLYDTLDNYLGVDGSISNLIKSYDSNVTYYNTKIETINKSIDKTADILRGQYESLQMQLLTLTYSYNSMNALSSGGY
ncbi:MAG: flagellar filament capping protein FliD [Bacteroidetes bacterium]|nr:flagellar filament capping protein FliD [Bacteroidota bacterium]MBU1115175.1 flagellar filament capping protein FliD [Bacteroidota bacterium]MBU1799346.1 flagellar filament capping protein FliD [Bacteroidota bacterium]